MTTVVLHKQVLAFDGQVMRGGTIVEEETRKLNWINDNLLIGGVGSANYAEIWGRLRLEYSFKKSLKKLPPIGNSAILEWSKKKQEFRVILEKGRFTRTDPEETIAYGSGSEYAYGALGMGASAVEAVKVAARYDPHTGKKVFWERLWK